jgi:hypothetical protein
LQDGLGFGGSRGGEYDAQTGVSAEEYRIEKSDASEPGKKEAEEGE